MSDALGNVRTRISWAGLRPLIAAMGVVAALALPAMGLLVARWQVWPPSPYTLDLGDAGVSASHFYGVEKSEERAFRWSRTLSAVSLPALGSSQVVSITLNPARPQAEAEARFRLLVGTRVVGEFAARPGWNTYTATVGPRFDPDIRLLIESDTFYPGAGDHRRLGVATAEIATAIQPSRFGLVWPPLLWLALAGLAPLWGFLWGRAFSPRLALALGGVAALLPVLISLLIPPGAALPMVAWLSGGIIALLFVRQASEWSLRENGLFSYFSRLGNSRWELPAVGLFVGALSLLMTWPLAGKIGGSMPGWPADNFAFLYKIWWFRTAIFERGQWPFFDPNSYAPFGFRLEQGEPTLLNTLPGAVIGALTNDVAAYNVLALLSFVVSGLGAYLLVREVTGSRWAALLGGVAFAFCPYRMTQFAGHIQLLGTGWIAFSFYFAERTLRTRQPKHGALMGLCLALTALGAWYYAYMVGLAVGLYFLARWWMLRREADLVSMVKPILAAGAVLLVVAGPVALPSLALWGQGGLTHSAKAADEHSAAPLDYILPNTLHPVWGEFSIRAHREENVMETSLYLGVVPVAIALFGWLVRRRRTKDEEPALSLPKGRRADEGQRTKDEAVHASRLTPHASRFTPLSIWAVWLVLLLITVILSLGLTLHDLNGQVLVGEGANRAPITLPGRLLYNWLPLYSSMRAYARFGALAALAMVVLMGLGWGAILGQARWRPRAGWLTLVALGLLLADFWSAPYAWGTSRVEPTEASKVIREAPPGSVMQMPLAASQSGPVLFWGTYYGKPVAYGYDTFEPPPWRAARDTLEEFPDVEALDILYGWGVRYIVVSANAYGADWPGTEAFLKGLPRLRHMGSFAERRTWEVDPRLLDARPDMVEFATPDTLAVFELLR